MKKVLQLCFIIVPILFSACNNEKNKLEIESALSEDLPEVMISEEPIPEEPPVYRIDYDDIEKSFSIVEPKYELLSFSQCNFSNEYDEEYILFFNDPSTIIRYTAPRDIDEVLVAFISDGIIKQLINTKLVSLGYDKKLMDIILKDSEKYGDWTEYCYLHDYDEDGLDELYF